MTTTGRTTIFAALVGLLATTACRDPLPCPDCDSADDPDEEGEPLPDLPCGGADLMTDNLNCGSCGHECLLYHPGSEYEAGTCNAGECGPGWTDCQVEGPFQSCAELCSALGQSCVPSGCAGYTGILFAVGFDGFGDCDPNTRTPVATMSGPCDEPIPWLTDGETSREVLCCCDFQ